MPDTLVAILAAGKGTRMRSARPKVLHEIAGVSLIEHVLRIADTLAPATTVIVVGHGADQVEMALKKRPGLQFALQEPQLGTGHALLQAETALQHRSGTLVLLSGDVPLLRPVTLERMVQHHHDRGAAATVLTALVDEPAGYGRVVRTGGEISSIVEDRDATEEQRRIREINSGIYAFDLAPLFASIRQIGPGNAQNEYYLPDLVRMYRERGLRVETVVLDDATEILGVNSRQELADLTAIMRTRRTGELMAAGVTVIDPATTWIGPDVSVGPDTVIHPGVHLEGRTTVGSNVVIQSNVRIVDSEVADGVRINSFCLIVESRIGPGASVGPFAHLRPQSSVGQDAHVGNFVELKKTSMGRGSKANHLAYLGDATIGERVNVGAGTITCNYDGTTKHPTIIEDGAFIGSDSQLIAPVRVGKDAYVAAGSSISEDVPPDSLAIARSRQVNKAGWVAKRRKKTGD
jgi:bifunctional UDP-N-acetylglucosamine pyrophosphorylase / glucosamine-1-phosphate N-acetyltransferase